MVVPYYLLHNFTNVDYANLEQGGEAYVFKGTHPFLKGDIAIKKWSHSPHNNKEKQVINQEVTLLIQNAGHLNIIEVLGILIDGESKCIGYIMPYMSRGNLDSIIHNVDKNYDDIYTSKQITSWITQICLGLSYLHAKDIIHRDIKPSNILLGNSYDDVKVSDFGIARSLENITHSLTKEIGTPVYMPPEMLNNEEYDISIDVYSLSITVWEILHRRVPFDHVTTKRHELSTKIINGERPELGNDLSNEVFDLLTSCWDVDFSQRPTSNDFLEFSKSTGFEVPEKKSVLILGGNDGMKSLDSLLVLQSNRENEENWKKMTIKLPYQIDNHGAQFLKNNLYIFGGRDASGNAINFTYKLSNKLEWEKMADMNQERFFISNSSVILNNQIWVLGGRDLQIRLKSVEMYDPIINKWKYMKEMNECRSDAAAAVVNEKIFCCGGWNGEKPLDSIECYDLSSDVWTFISNMPQPLYGFGTVVIDGNLVGMGGWNGKDYFKNIWIFDTSDKTVKSIDKPSTSIVCRNYSIAKIDKKIFVCGGDHNHLVISSAGIFDGEVWRHAPNLTNPRFFAPATVIPTNFGKYLEYGITRFGRTKPKLNGAYSQRTIQNFATSDIDLEKETILLFGGWNGKELLDNLLIAQKSEENWKTLTLKLPYPIYRHGAQFLNNCLYIFGGQNGKFEMLNYTYKLSISFEWHTLSNKLKWRKMADMNQERAAISKSSVILNGRIWVIGGKTWGNAFKSVEMYDPSRNTWKYMKDMNECRSFAAAVVVNEKIFCCGGQHVQKWFNSVECYDPSSDVWTFISNMPQPLLGLAAVAMDGKLIVMGGWNGDKDSKSVWELDTSDKSDVWIDKPSMSHPRSNLSIAKIDNKVFVCGGSYEDDTLDCVEIFNGKLWSNGPKLPVSPSDATAIVIPRNFAGYLE